MEKRVYVAPRVEVGDHVRAFLSLADQGLAVSDVETACGYRAAYHPDQGLLTCVGCAHSAASVPWPGRPSGESACGSCIRNTEMWGDHPKTSDNYCSLSVMRRLLDLHFEVRQLQDKVAAR